MASNVKHVKRDVKNVWRRQNLVRGGENDIGARHRNAACKRKKKKILAGVAQSGGAGEGIIVIWRNVVAKMAKRQQHLAL